MMRDADEELTPTNTGPSVSYQSQVADYSSWEAFPCAVSLDKRV